MAVLEHELRNFDLNLLRLFKAVLEHRNISRAARDLGITQPAASNALRRLRDVLRDDLFVSGSDGMTPTIYAESFARDVLPSLLTIDQHLLTSGSFDPKRWTQTLRIGVTDYAVSTSMPSIVPALISGAPLGRFHQVVMRERNPHDELRDGELDIAIGSFTKEPANFFQKKLSTDSFSVILRKGHPLAKKDALDLESFAEASHLLIAPWGSAWGAVDEALGQKNLQRRIALTVPYFASAPDMVSKTDLISTVPSGLAEVWEKEFGIEVRKPPLKLPDFSIHLLWHKRTHKSAIHEWLRRVVVESLKLT